jgi:hypothetical protein
MNVEPNQRRAVLSWLFVGTLLVLCGVLGVLQYRWIGEVSLAARDRLRGSLRASLDRLSQDFNSEIAEACRALVPANSTPDPRAAEAEFAVRYQQWKRTARNGRIFRAIAIAQPQGKAWILRRLDLETGAFETIEWPAGWTPILERLQRNRPGPPPEDDGATFDLPLFGMPPRGAPSTSLIFEIDLPYVRDVMLPELTERHLGSDYQVEVVARAAQPSPRSRQPPPRTLPPAFSKCGSIRSFAPRDRGAGADPAEASAGIPAAGRCWCGTALDRSKRWSRKPAGATWPSPRACFC